MTKENSATTSFASPLHAPATLDARETAGTFLTLTPGDVPAYTALSDGAACFTLAPRHVSRFVGTGAMGALNGLITNDVTKLEVGRGMYAAALTPKGKVLADLAVLRIQPETFLVESSASAGAEWFAMVRKYVNPRLAQYTDESATLSVIALCGPHAARVLARAGSASGGGAMVTDALTDALSAWKHFTSGTWKISNGEARLVHMPYLGATPCFVLLIDANKAASVLDQLTGLGALLGSDDVWKMARLESGRPEFGADMDGASLPQEANLDAWSAISFEKGCYTGQETVARIHFRGHVNRHLRALHSAMPLSVGAPLVDAAGKSVGEVRRSGHSPKLGPLAIGMIRREVASGSELFADAFGARVSAIVTELPYDTSASGPAS